MRNPHFCPSMERGVFMEIRRDIYLNSTITRLLNVLRAYDKCSLHIDFCGKMVYYLGEISHNPTEVILWQLH